MGNITESGSALWASMQNMVLCLQIRFKFSYFGKLSTEFKMVLTHETGGQVESSNNKKKLEIKIS
jgi:hypothetical protein